MIYPGLEQFRRMAEEGNLVPVYRELPADLETPVSVFLKLKQRPPFPPIPRRGVQLNAPTGDGGERPAFLLESVEGGEQLGRYSFLGTNPSLVVQSRGKKAHIRDNGHSRDVDLSDRDPLHLLEELLARYRVVKTPGLPRFFGGAIGYLGYDTVRFFEDLPEPEVDELDLPDSIFLFTDTMVIFDHVQHRMKVVSNAHVNGDPDAAYREAVDKIEDIVRGLARPLGLPIDVSACGGTREELTSNFTIDRYCELVLQAKEYITAGDIFQVVLSQRLRRRTTASPFSIYRALRMLNPSPYMFYLELGDFQLIGSSPEMLVKLEDGKAETRPIAGTRPRGKTPEEDEELKQDLMADPKERAEHVMLVDLGRNDVGRVCQYGTVRVPTLMTVEKYSHVMHIVSAVEGRIGNGRTSFDLIRAAFPAGTVSGAPKIRAMEIINELEGLRRGPYSGAVGYFGYDGNMDTCITIRTIVMKGDTVYLQAGGGIVADSDPYREHEETINKSKALARAVQMAEEETL